MQGLEPGLTYQFRGVAVDGQYHTPSRIQDVIMYATFPTMTHINHGDEPPAGFGDSLGPLPTEAGWFIGMVLASLTVLAVFSSPVEVSQARDRVQTSSIQLKYSPTFVSQYVRLQFMSTHL